MASYREVPLQEMPDGQVQDGPKVLSARKRLGMVGVLAVVAGTAVFFNAEEQAAEAKIWDSEMAGLRNATALADQQNRRFVFANGISWTAADEKCKALGVSICKAPQVCREQDKKKKNKDMLKTGKNTNKNGLLRQLCAGKGAPGANKAKGKMGKAKGGGGGGLVNVCSSSEQQDLKSRWVPLVDGASHVWANVDTCDIKTSVPGEKEQGVVACCGEGGAWAHKGVFAAVHPAPVIQAASKMVKQRKQAKASNEDDWSKHEYIDKMRNSDPFLAHKKKGTKMKAVHDHVAEQASQHLGNATVSAVADGLASIHGKIKSHITNVVDALKAGSNSTSIGAVSGALRTSDPSNSYKMAPVSKLAAAANARNASLASSVWGNAMQTARSAITAARGDASARFKAGGAGPGGAAGKAGSAGGDTRAFSGRKGPQQGDMGDRRGADAAKAGKAGGGRGAGGRPDGAVETRRPMMMSTPGN